MRPAVLCVASIVEVSVDGAFQQREHLLRGLAGELGPGGGGVAPPPRVSQITWTLTLPLDRAER